MRLIISPLKLIGKISVVLLFMIALVAGIVPRPNNVKAAGSVSEREPNNITYSANLVTMGDEVYGNVHKNNDGLDYDYFKIVLPSSGLLKISFIKADDEWEWPNENRIIGCFYQNDDSDDNELDSFLCKEHSNHTYYLKKGVYYLCLLPDESSSGICDLDYSFICSFTSANESFAETGRDDYMGGANTVCVGKNYKGQLAINDDMDYYKVTLSFPGTLYMYLVSDDLSYCIFDANGETIENGINDRKEVRTSNTLPKGTYYIQISKGDLSFNNGDSGNYTFTLSYAKAVINTTSISLTSGYGKYLVINNLPDNVPVAWKSSNSSVASVNSVGTVLGVKAGYAYIYATFNGVTNKCLVQVLYRDVTNTGDFWYKPTYYLTNRDIVKGYGKQTLFKPGNKCTRAQMVTFLWRLKGNPEPNSNSCSFKDVKKSAYYYKAVVWAVEKGITTGYSKTKFKPNNVCTRAQTVTFLWRMAGKPNPTSNYNKFTDVRKKDYFYNAVLWASEKKIVEGYKNNTFRPNNKCLRRQMVTFLYKYKLNVK